MANKEVKEIDPNRKLELSVTDILALITKLQADQAKLLADTGNKNAEVLSESLAKLSPHYKTPDQIANDKQLKAVSREGELKQAPYQETPATLLRTQERPERSSQARRECVFLTKVVSV